MMRMNANICVEQRLDELAEQIGKHFKAHTVAIRGPILGQIDLKLRDALEIAVNVRRKPRAVVILDTDGGVVELVERMVITLRHHFEEVDFIIPDRAMSAGTIFAMSGDSIWMDYFSCLGPIDPQVERDGKLVPALSYVDQFEELVEKSLNGTISTAELVLLQKLDLADLQTYQQARDLSISLLEEWLSNYKFKDWHHTETRRLEVTPEMRRQRAKEVAEALSDHRRWKTHARPITMKILTDQLKLRINDLGTRPDLRQLVRLYFQLLVDYTFKTQQEQVVHSKGFLA